ncbi:hypothetical protein K435DRAFT_807306 [Dendrothele bispora CBS 962.96]|uniref:peptidylprolyl isomerase n=1 Tax=Dendrothele bispora (strain CBS 962.96) TaxID=1314807 RepID=A0A4S8L548_DENBC|nr:hypothetical protein K435DRAFT_807306 [Dendrothele bispora CBS 962.96]
MVGLKEWSTVTALQRVRHGSIVFELYDNVAPKTARNFRELATGQHGLVYWQPELIPLCNPPVHALGRRLHGNATGGKSIYGSKLPASPDFSRWQTPEKIPMVPSFSSTLSQRSGLIATHVFGEVVEGMDVVKAVEAKGPLSGKETRLSKEATSTPDLNETLIVHYLLRLSTSTTITFESHTKRGHLSCCFIQQDHLSNGLPMKLAPSRHGLHPGSTPDTTALVSPNETVFASCDWTVVLLQDIGVFVDGRSFPFGALILKRNIWTAPAALVTEMLGGGSNCNYVQFHPSESLTSPIPNATDAFFLLALSF